MSREACATTRGRPATRPESFVTVSGGQYPRVLASCDLVPHPRGARVRKVRAYRPAEAAEAGWRRRSPFRYLCADVDDPIACTTFK